MSSFHYTGPCIYFSRVLSVLSVQFFTKTRRYNFINELLSLGVLLIRFFPLCQNYIIIFIYNSIYL